MDPSFPVLSLLIFLPLAGALLIALLPGKHTPTHGFWQNTPGTLQQQARWIALITSLGALVIAVVLFIIFDRGQAGFQFVDEFAWINAESVGFDIGYAFGVDGLSMPLVLLTAVLSTVAVLVSWNIDLRPKEYFAWLLVLQTSVLGVFTSLDLIFFFLFWELELIPMFLLISTWGSGNRNYSALKFVLYTIFGSAFMLVGFLVLGSAADTFDIRELRGSDLSAAILPLQAVFAFILIAFAVKLPVVPLHTWLPDAHTDAPTAVSVLLAGVLLKMGGYGILRLLFTLMPDVGADADLALAIIGAVSIVYGAIVTMRQTDLKRLIAYSSVSHMGFVLLGVSALGVTGMSGAALQLVTHGSDHGHALRDGRPDLRPHPHAPDRRDARPDPLHAATGRGPGLRGLRASAYRRWRDSWPRSRSSSARSGGTRRPWLSRCWACCWPPATSSGRWSARSSVRATRSGRA